MQAARSLGKYRLVAALGQGGTAKVYLALRVGPAGFSKLLVIKILREDRLAGSAESVQMFWEEARIAARLSHPNIVQTHEVGSSGGRYFIAMEYLDGQPYSAFLGRARKASVAPAEHLRIIAEVARALYYAHHLRSHEGAAIGVIHRDVSPQNVFIGYDGQVKLLDFGVARTEDAEHVTRVGIIKGKLDYIAPEQLRGDAIDHRVDIFALGAVLWEALTGQRFAGGRKVSDVNKVQTRLSGGERKIQEVRPGLPGELVQIVERAIALDPADRFPDAGALADALEAYLHDVGERPSAKSLGPLVSTLFAAERADMNERIAAHMQAVRRSVSSEADESTGSLPRIERSEPDDGTVSLSPENRQESASAPRPSLRTEAGPSLGAPAMRQKTVLAALLVAAVMVAGGLLALLLPARRDEARVPAVESALAGRESVLVTGTTQPSPTRLPESPRPSVSAHDGAARLRIDVSPSSARLRVDGVAVSVPFEGEFQAGSTLHVVEASADGYRTLKQFVALERDQTMVLSLERISSSSSSRRPPRAEPARRSEAVHEATAPPAEPAPPPAPKPALPGSEIELPSPPPGADQIDQANPYRN